MEDSILDDKELFQKLEQAQLAERLKTSPEWMLFQEGIKRAIEKWTDYFVFKMDSRNISDVETVRSMIRIYKYDLFKGLEILKMEGEVAFEELKFRNQIRQPSPQEGNET